LLPTEQEGCLSPKGEGSKGNEKKLSHFLPLVPFAEPLSQRERVLLPLTKGKEESKGRVSKQRGLNP